MASGGRGACSGARPAPAEREVPEKGLGRAWRARGSCQPPPPARLHCIYVWDLRGQGTVTHKVIGYIRCAASRALCLGSRAQGPALGEPPPPRGLVLLTGRSPATPSSNQAGAGPGPGLVPSVVTPYGAGIWYEQSSCAKAGAGRRGGGFGTTSPRPRRQLTPRCPHPRAASFVWWWEGEAHPQGSPRSAPAESKCSPGWEAGLGGGVGAHRGPPGAHSLLSTGCCRHISLPAEMMGR